MTEEEESNEGMLLAFDHDDVSVYTASTTTVAEESTATHNATRSSTRARRPGAWQERLARAKAQANYARNIGWEPSMRAAALDTDRLWEPRAGWLGFDDFHNSAYEDVGGRSSTRGGGGTKKNDNETMHLDLIHEQRKYSQVVEERGDVPHGGSTANRTGEIVVSSRQEREESEGVLSKSDAKVSTSNSAPGGKGKGTSKSRKVTKKCSTTNVAAAPGGAIAVRPVGEGTKLTNESSTKVKKSNSRRRKGGGESNKGALKFKSKKSAAVDKGARVPGGADNTTPIYGEVPQETSDAEPLLLSYRRIKSTSTITRPVASF